ncbi:MAG: hypothetical protein QG606_421 [Patescibacteria group bacterium]|nr:hypothetical protein [Patescibacteria group bacterium]
MKSRSRTLINIATAWVLAFFVAVTCQVASAATENLGQSTWVVTMEGHYLTWILRISQVDSGGQFVGTYDGTLNNDAKRPISGSVSHDSGQTILTYTTPSGTPVSVTRQPDGNFSGIFTNKKGVQKRTTLRLIQEAEIPSLAEEEKRRQAQQIIPPKEDVPASCAFFGGAWQGQWNTSGYGVLHLWVEDINQACRATIRYSDKPMRGKTGIPVQMESNGSFSFVCNQATGGTCVVSKSGNDVYVNYTNPQGGKNGAALTKQ